MQLWLNLDPFSVAGPSLWNRLPSSDRASFLSSHLSTSLGAVHKDVKLFLTNFPPPALRSHLHPHTRTPHKGGPISDPPPPKDCLASICTSELCKERSYKY